MTTLFHYRGTLLSDLTPEQARQALAELPNEHAGYTEEAVRIHRHRAAEVREELTRIAGRKP
jgi:hypothetical protein